jgi:hypothetical protein
MKSIGVYTSQIVQIQNSYCPVIRSFHEIVGKHIVILFYHKLKGTV